MEPDRPDPPGSQSGNSAPEGKYSVDPSRSIVTFKAKAFGLIWVEGGVPVSGGDISFSSSGAQASGRIDTRKIYTGLSIRDKHLRSSHYLSSNIHPYIEVELRVDGDVKSDVTCIVTVRGQTHPVSLVLARLEPNADHLRVKLTTALDRSPFRMLHPIAGVSRVIHLEADLVATPV